MTTKVEKSVLVNVPVSIAYNQWTQFEDFPQFMKAIKQVTQLGDDRLEWVAEVMGVRRQWTARILEQVPDRKVAWAATEGATNAGAVTFEDVGGGQTSVHLSLEYEPTGVLEGLGDKLHLVENEAEGDLSRFKEFIESEGYAGGAWRGTINEGGSVGTPGVEDAAGSRGDSGKAGVSGAVLAAGAAAAVAGVTAAAAASASSKDTDADASDVRDDVAPPTAGGTGGTAATHAPLQTEPFESGTVPPLADDATPGPLQDNNPGALDDVLDPQGLAAERRAGDRAHDDRYDPNA